MYTFLETRSTLSTKFWIQLNLSQKQIRYMVDAFVYYIMMMYLKRNIEHNVKANHQ